MFLHKRMLLTTPKDFFKGQLQKPKLSERLRKALFSQTSFNLEVNVTSSMSTRCWKTAQESRATISAGSMAEKTFSNTSSVKTISWL